MLMEEDLEDRTCMLQDCLALQAAEKSFYDVLQPLSDEFGCSTDQNGQIPDETFTPTESLGSSSSHNCTDQGEFESSLLQPSQFSSSFLSPNYYGQLNGAMKNVSFVGKSSPCPSKLKGRKNDEQEDADFWEEARIRKHSLIVSTEESEQLVKFDKSFLQKVENNESIPCPLYDASRNKESKRFQHNAQSQASNTRIRRLASNDPSREMIDLSTQLIHCAQAAGSGDQTTAYEQLKLIKLHSSPFGNGNQRLAHYFAKALETRLAGSAKSSRTSLLGAGSTAADILRAYQFYVSICPFRKMTNFFTNRTIAEAAEKATTLHIIDFGISYGFQWPCLIYRLSTRPGGPPKIRITGIDFPQTGFRPAERVEETGRRLKKLADKLNVPFEFNAIAQKWDSIKIEDLKIEKDEAVAVCCMNRLKNLPDDTIQLNSPRDAVLNLIKSINPDVFVHGIVNGNYNAPFFVSRFREALFHFSAIFDMLEGISEREDEERMVFERELIGKDVMKVIAYEGVERNERPETYKQWQMRNCRMGFEQVSLKKEIMKRVRNIKNDYHKDFVIDEDGSWMLMGWKGRITHAISVWKPAHH
ncbi:scarecrow-like protein 14 [Euphorbia lathyris]|uniref:scarecrow-like protein 14 n=1 Tax=Euphorbia lathyris TaxID=212925 RepID=UPI0033135AC0